jgi:methylglutaconyl-CoA hydratase
MIGEAASGGVLIFETDGPVARLTLNRPEKRNALNAALITALIEALARADADDAVRVVTLRGAGKDFSAGADLADLDRIATASVVENLHDADLLAKLFLTIRELRKPVVALVHGRAIAGGCGLATACDLVLAAESSSFGYSEVRLGFVPAIVMAVLRRNVSEKRAFDLIATGDLHPAAEMERIGLINRVLPDADFDAAAEAYVQALGGRSASAIWLSKRLLYNQDGMTYDAAVRSGTAINVLARMTDDTREGVARFVRERGGG